MLREACKLTLVGSHLVQPAHRYLLRYAATMSQSVALKCLDRYGFPLAGLTAAEQAVRAEAAARETKLQEKWSRQVS